MAQVARLHSGHPLLHPPPAHHHTSAVPVGLLYNCPLRLH